MMLFVCMCYYVLLLWEICILLCENVSRFLPSITIPSFTYSDAVDLVDGVQNMCKVQLLSADQVTIFNQ